MANWSKNPLGWACFPPSAPMLGAIWRRWMAIRRRGRGGEEGGIEEDGER